ncbi:MAG TPA: DUF2378 family protein [Polyangiaceae bacterium]|nr:DUF2378 family protein [Polyangiaceae bacterium]
MSDDRLTKGFNVEQTITFIDSHFSAAVRDQIVAQLAPDMREKLPRVRAGNWYPIGDLVALLTAMAHVAASEPEAERTARALGRHLSDAATGTFMRLLLKVMTPPVFLKKMPDIWPRMFSFGSFEVDPTGFKDKRASMIMRGVDGFDHVAPVSAGWIEGVHAAMGCGGVDVRYTGLEAEPRGSAFRFEVKWS